MAQPSESLPSSSGTTSVALASTAVGPAVVSLESSAVAVAVGQPLQLRMNAALAEEASSVQLRLTVMRPSGRTIFQRTRTTYDPEKGARISFSFERQTGDLDLRPGVYPVEVEARVVADGTVHTETAGATLLVYDPTAAPVRVALVARVFAPPMSDSQGRFTSDPASFTRARDEVGAITDYILQEPQARMTLAVAPILLEEWKRISQGYEIIGPEGVTSYPATSPTAQTYGAALTRLSQALATGRLELMSLGYADPNISDLAANDLTADTTEQYAAGVSAVFTALETTPSPGSAPAGGCVPGGAVDALISSDVDYVVVRPRCARSSDTTVGSGVYRAGDKQLIALVSDDVASRAVASGNDSATIAAAFARHISDDPSVPLPVLVELGPGRATANSSVVNAAREYSRQPWTRLVRARDVARSPRARVRLVSAPKDTKAPNGYWAEVREARSYAAALTSATSAADANAAQAQRDSLLAQSSAWAGPAGDWSLAERGRAFSAASLRTSKGILEAVRLSVSAVTLSGTRGDVPVTITNGTDKTLELQLVSEPGASLELAGSGTTTITLKPRETFVEIPVDLQNSLSGRLTVSVVSGPVKLDSSTVVVRASYLDRLAIIGGIVIALGILLAFIIRRVRGAEAVEMPTSDDAARYTDDAGADDPREDEE